MTFTLLIHCTLAISCANLNIVMFVHFPKCAESGMQDRPRRIKSLPPPHPQKITVMGNCAVSTRKFYLGGTSDKDV